MSEEDLADVKEAFGAALRDANLSSSNCVVLYGPASGEDEHVLSPCDAATIMSGYAEKVISHGFVLPLPGRLLVILYFKSRVPAFVPPGLMGFSARNVRAVTSAGIGGFLLYSKLLRCCQTLQCAAAKDPRVVDTLRRSCAAVDVGHVSDAPLDVSEFLARVQAVEQAVQTALAGDTRKDAQVKALEERVVLLEAATLRLRADLQLVRNSATAAAVPRQSALLEVFPHTRKL